MSPWSNATASGAAIQSPPGRFIQVRARWGNAPDATLEEVTIPFLTDNLRPVVTELEAAAKGGVRETREGLVGSGSDAPKHDGTVHVTWRVDNPDGDALRYRVAYRKEDQTAWHDMLKPEEILSKTELDWDTTGLPEGKYRVRVEASDEAANPPDQVQRHQLETGGVLVDNTPPTIVTVGLVGRKLKVHVQDGASPIARIEVSYDGKTDFRPLAPADGIFDAADESVDTDIGALVPGGSHIVAVRAYDAAGNMAVKDVEAK